MSTSAAKPVGRKKKTKEAVKSAEFIRNDGTDSDSEDLIPKFFEPIRTYVEEVDWDTLKANPDIELWAVRIPHGFASKHLDNLSFSLPSPSRPGRLHTFKRKGVAYNINEVAHNPAPQDEEFEDFGAEEMGALSCLVPRKSKNGQLYAAPIPISRNIVISAALPVPNPVSASDASGENDSVGGLNGPSDRPIQPTHLLKHRFFPTGSLIKTDGDDGDSSLAVADVNTTATMDVDPSTEPVTPRKSKKEGSKRKAPGEGDGSVVKEKVKKVKTTKLAEA